MTESELKKHLEAAEKSPKQVAAAVSGLPEKVLRYKPAPDKWCILEILGHLADVEIVYAYRLRQMLADKKPVIAPMDQDDWARNLGYHGDSSRGTGCPLWSESAREPATVAAAYAGRPGKVGLSSRNQAGLYRGGVDRKIGDARGEPSGAD